LGGGQTRRAREEEEKGEPNDGLYVKSVLIELNDLPLSLAAEDAREPSSRDLRKDGIEGLEEERFVELREKARVSLAA
jgi:hypothetical protein